MNTEARLDTIKIICLAVFLSLLAALVRHGSAAILFCIIVMVCFACLWLWQWERRLQKRAN
jgi:uncharacterized membrane protein